MGEYGAPGALCLYQDWSREIAGVGQASVDYGFLLLIAAVPMYVWRAANGK